LKNNENSPQRMAVFFREIKDLDDLDPKLKSKFSDTDDETRQLLDITNTCIRDALPADSIFTYRVCTNKTCV